MKRNGFSPRTLSSLWERHFSGKVVPGYTDDFRDITPAERRKLQAPPQPLKVEIGVLSGGAFVS